MIRKVVTSLPIFPRLFAIRHVDKIQSYLIIPYFRFIISPATFTEGSQQRHCHINFSRYTMFKAEGNEVET